MPPPPLPIIQCMRQLGDPGAIELDDVVASLQQTYPEYSRRKRQAFRSLVGRLCQSLRTSEEEEEEWLEQREKAHFEKRLREANSNDQL